MGETSHRAQVILNNLQPALCNNKWMDKKNKWRQKVNINVVAQKWVEQNVMRSLKS